MIEPELIVGHKVVIVVGQNQNDYPTVVDMEPWQGDRTGLMPFGPSLAPASVEPEPEPEPDPDLPF